MNCFRVWDLEIFSTKILIVSKSWDQMRSPREKHQLEMKSDNQGPENSAKYIGRKYLESIYMGYFNSHPLTRTFCSQHCTECSLNSIYQVTHHSSPYTHSSKIFNSSQLFLQKHNMAYNYKAVYSSAYISSAFLTLLHLYSNFHLSQRAFPVTGDWTFGHAILPFFAQFITPHSLNLIVQLSISMKSCMILLTRSYLISHGLKIYQPCCFIMAFATL